MSLNRKPTDLFNRLLRYGVQGICINLAGYVAFILLCNAGYDPVLSSTALYPPSVIASYYINRIWVFGSSANVAMEASKFIALHLFGSTLNFVIMFLGVNILMQAPWLIQAISIFATALTLFLLSNHFIFTAPKAKNSI